MLKLFFVVLYKFRGNVYQRVMLTSADSEMAGKAACDNYAGFSVHRVDFVCHTDNEVWMEV